MLTAGDDGVDGRGCLPGNRALMPLDAETGYLGRWSRYGEAPDDELDTLVTYLEEAADMLEAPALATRDTPGLIGGALMWLSRIDPAREDRRQPLTG